MPKGKFVNHKGRNRHFTNPEELEEQRRIEEEKKKWRQQHGGGDSSESDSDDKGGDKHRKSKGGSSSSDSDSESSSDEETVGKAKGVSNLIQIENPNRVQKKTKKLSALNEELSGEAATAKPDLSRRELDEIERQRAQARYQKLHAEGKTEQARADLARLAIIKKQREEAAKKRDLEKQQKEEAVKAKTAQTQKALGKKT